MIQIKTHRKSSSRTGRDVLAASNAMIDPPNPTVSTSMGAYRRAHACPNPAASEQRE